MIRAVNFQTGRHHPSIQLFFIAFLFVLTACSGKKETVHPALKAEGGGPSATVYLLRPGTERAMGFPDNDLNIVLNNERLLSLTKGEYTVVRLAPRNYTLTLKNLSETGPDWLPKPMEKNFPFTFVAGKTYFLLITPVDGEFRGVYFNAEMIDLYAAKQISNQLRAVGDARSSPIAAIK